MTFFSLFWPCQGDLCVTNAFSFSCTFICYRRMPFQSNPIVCPLFRYVIRFTSLRQRNTFPRSRDDGPGRARVIGLNGTEINSKIFYIISFGVRRGPFTTATLFINCNLFIQYSRFVIIKSAEAIQIFFLLVILGQCQWQGKKETNFLYFVILKLNSFLFCFVLGCFIEMRVGYFIPLFAIT